MSGVGGLAKALATNRGVRRVIAKGATRAAASASSAIASKRAEGSSVAGSKESPFWANPIDAVSKTLVTSVAKPMAEKLATSEAGRSLLETIHSISGDALGKTPKRPEGAFDTVIRLAGAAASAAGAASLARAKTSTARSGPSSSRSHEPAVKRPQPFTAKPDAQAKDGNP